MEKACRSSSCTTIERPITDTSNHAQGHGDLSFSIEHFRYDTALGETDDRRSPRAQWKSTVRTTIDDWTMLGSRRTHMQLKDI
jgi:hypothetical protein